MGDFYLDFRDPETRRACAARAASLVKWCEDTRIQTIESDSFSLVLSRVDGFDVWGPCRHQQPDGEIIVALAGRIALDESDWETARQSSFTGGLASKAILQQYLARGLDGLTSLNGNFVVFVYDGRSSEFHIVTDRCGMFIAYTREPFQQSRVLCSHPDVLASILGETDDLDLVSLAEFLTTGRLTFPYTYYRAIRGLSTCSIHTVHLGVDFSQMSVRRYFEFSSKVDGRVSEEELAQKLAAAFGNAVRRRVLPIFGQTGIGLSGGLDSRAILSAARTKATITAFNLYDEENLESRTAAQLADASGVRLFPIRRDFEYYANAAEQGVRISGGVGNIASNHFLGIRQRLSELGIHNLLTGCYCDYLLKGLSLNTREHKFSRSERMVGFNFQYYHGVFWDRTTYSERVKSRLEALFPESAQDRLSPEDWLNVERKRAFPLAYEGDLAQRVIPQRVIPWFIPIVDNDLLDVYLRIPSGYKLNASLFKKMVQVLCADGVGSIPDSNTGAPIGASSPRYAFHRFASALRNRIQERLVSGMATAGSWPNWQYYIQHSSVIASLWNRKNSYASEIFAGLLRSDPLQHTPAAFAGRSVEFFMRLFTLKLWLDQRCDRSLVQETMQSRSVPQRAEAQVGV